MGEEHRYIVDVRFLNGVKSPLDKEAYFDIKSNEYEISSLCIEGLYSKKLAKGISVMLLVSSKFFGKQNLRKILIEELGDKLDDLEIGSIQNHNFF